ncbi:lipocalin family protein [Ralstonia pickettii]|uniref:lipocalin family protein n=1 Tax=Ralstonia pickettii TaxID=329 RepID=UPI0027154D00|nr:lipocalin family protein [Ralstonia pickettii]WKZ86478.1 lipocalin family protein [Ralstonia pickettii]
MTSRKHGVIVAGVAALTTASLLTLLRASRVGNPQVPEPALPVDLNRYVGLWYELARYDNGFERGLDNVTAEYRVRSDGLLEVINQGWRHGRRRRRISHGKARVVAEQNNKLKVSFFGPFYVGDYWILDRADDYEWAIVGEPSGRYLWLLTRSPDVAGGTRARLIRRAQALGYDTSLLRFTAHHLS